MAPLEFPNTDFFNLQSSLIQLLRALDDASTQRTVRKGARQSAQAPTQEFNTNVQGDLRSVLQSPLYKREPRGYSALQLDAVHSIRPLHESIVRLLTRGTVNATDTVDNEDTDTDLRGRLHDFVESVDPAHPFLQIALETKDTSGGDVDDDDDDDGEGAGAEQQKKKKKKKQALSKKAKGKQRADRDASHGAARLAAAPELRRSARLRAHATQGYATAQEADDLVQEPVSGSEDTWQDLSDGRTRRGQRAGRR